MKIVFVTDVYYPSVGGVEVETRRLASELSRSGNEVWIISPSFEAKDFSRKEDLINIVGIKSYFNPLYKSVRFIPISSAKKKIFRILDNINPDIIHIQTCLSLSKAASAYAKKFRVPTTATGHYAGGELESNFRKSELVSGIIEHLVKISYKSVWKNVDFLTFPSNFSLNYFSDAIKDENKALVLSNGINTEKFKGSFKKPRERKIILFVGRLETSKHVDTIIRSMPKIFSKVNSNLLLVGGGSQEHNLRELADRLGIIKKVKFMGFASEEKVRRIYKKADVFVTASEAENQPLVVLEAMASGLPIVASNVGGIPELVRDGRNGYLFQPDDLDGLAEKVLEIISNKGIAVKMGEESINIAKEHDISDVIYKLESVYQKAIAINSLKSRNVSHRWLFARVALAVIMVGLLFRWTFLAPSTAKAKSARVGERIKNFKIIKGLENFDSKLKMRIAHKGL